MAGRDRPGDQGGCLGARVGLARSEIGRQRPAGLGPDGGVGAVGLLPLVVVGRALLHVSVHLDCRGVEIDGGALRGEGGPALVGQSVERHCDERGVRPLDPRSHILVEALPDPDHRRRGRDRRHGAQCETGGVGSLVVQVGEEVASGEHRLGERDHDLAEPESPSSLLHRRCHLVDGPGDREQRVELGHQVQSGPRREAAVRGTEGDPGVLPRALLPRYPLHLTGAFPLGSWNCFQLPFSQVRGTLSRMANLRSRHYSRISV